jgi:hypothetical protein
MVTDNQVRRLRKLSNTEKNQEIAASKVSMDPKTARKYLALNQLPSEVMKVRHWRTREDPFSGVWEQVRQQIEESPGLEAKTLFEWLQREYPGQFQDGQIRTLQRRIKLWRATEGPAQEVYFSQKHEPGRLCASDFTHMAELGITIQGQTFAHLVYHFVLTYSNWETGTICYSECLESLSEGWQNAIWGFGGSSGRAPSRRPVERSEQHEHPGGVQPALPSADEVLRGKAGAHEPGESSRKRRWRAKSLPDKAEGTRDFAVRLHGAFRLAWGPSAI